MPAKLQTIRPHSGDGNEDDAEPKTIIFFFVVSSWRGGNRSRITAEDNNIAR